MGPARRLVEAGIQEGAYLSEISRSAKEKRNVVNGGKGSIKR